MSNIKPQKYEKIFDPLIDAVTNSHYDQVEKLINKKNCNAVNSSGEYLIVIAGKNDDGRMIHMLCQYGADPNAQMQDGRTALMQIAIMENLMALDAILKNGAELDMSDNHNDTAVNLAVAHGKVASFVWLMREGASPTTRNNDNMNCIEHAKVNKSPDMIGALKAFEVVAPWWGLEGNLNVGNKIENYKINAPTPKPQKKSTNIQNIKKPTENKNDDEDTHSFDTSHIYASAAIILCVIFWNDIGPYANEYIFSIPGKIWDAFLKWLI